MGPCPMTHESGCASEAVPSGTERGGGGSCGVRREEEKRARREEQEIQSENSRRRKRCCPMCRRVLFVLYSSQHIYRFASPCAGESRTHPFPATQQGGVSLDQGGRKGNGTGSVKKGHYGPAVYRIEAPIAHQSPCCLLRSEARWAGAYSFDA